MEEQKIPYSLLEKRLEEEWTLSLERKKNEKREKDISDSQKRLSTYRKWLEGIGVTDIPVDLRHGIKINHISFYVDDNGDVTGHKTCDNCWGHMETFPLHTRRDLLEAIYGNPYFGKWISHTCPAKYVEPSLLVRFLTWLFGSIKTAWRRA